MSEFKNEIKAIAGQFSKDDRQGRRMAKEAKHLRKKMRRGGQLDSKDRQSLRKAQRFLLDTRDSFE